MKKYPAKKRSLPKPRQPWQTGEYHRHQQFKFIIPYQFLLLCKLWDIPPSDLLQDFMDALGHGSWQRDITAGARAQLVQYILANQYGRKYYTQEELLQQFKELDGIGSLFPGTGDATILEAYYTWRDKYYEWWFEKWYNKNIRKI